MLLPKLWTPPCLEGATGQTLGIYTVRHSHEGISLRNLDKISSLVRRIPPIFNPIANLKGEEEKEGKIRQQTGRRSLHFGSTPGNAKY